mmetsp:Transcript_27646/g.39539  ORF Transcript_27646/g.39539 Transcript_27646/m.39539 type:complete len:118 (+) Transcript_27646:131-484(+)|eukprot:CAMPEP_0172422880 /NCGR_PEP_ID=MMETSP1064-20121228/8994_1 /TAXON_ID=202472 /ORGANISM="Aulacoseira subarctica , Strain CCAP 1002/5" /LENGTH=117 /DNA_ID=CAMNT_0013163963 /DNA_START=127 /DNA_END=480 /DNA_ORIENTATION=+
MQTYQKPGISQEGGREIEPKRGFWKWLLLALVLLAVAAGAVRRSRQFIVSEVESVESLVKSESTAAPEVPDVTNVTEPEEVIIEPDEVIIEEETETNTTTVEKPTVRHGKKKSPPPV